MRETEHDLTSSVVDRTLRTEVRERADEERDRLERMQQASETDLLFEVGQYSDDHPATMYLQGLLGGMLQEGEDFRVRVTKESKPNAFALGANRIYISEGMYRLVASEEALQALLTHELAHLRHQDSLSSLRELGRHTLASLSQERLQEFRADLDSLVELDRCGINPQGAIELQEAFVRQGQSSRSDHSVDLVHGSPEMRKMNLREVMRFHDFHFIRHELTPLDASLLDEPEIAATPGDCRETWRRLKADLDSGSVSDLKASIMSNVRQFTPGLSVTAEDLLVAWLWARYLKVAIDYSSLSEIAEAFVELIERQVFETIGLMLSERDLVDIISEAAAQSLRALPIPEATEYVRQLREYGRSYCRKVFGEVGVFDTDLDTRLVGCYFDAISINPCTHSQTSGYDEYEHEISIWSVPRQVAVINDQDASGLMSYLSAVGLVDYNFADIHARLFGRLLPEVNLLESNLQSSGLTYFADGESRRNFQRWVQPLCQSIDVLIEAADLPENPVGSLAACERYLDFIGKSLSVVTMGIDGQRAFDEQLYRDDEDLDEIGRKDVSAQVLWVTSYANELTAVEPLAGVVEKFMNAVERLTTDGWLELIDSARSGVQIRKLIDQVDSVAWPVITDRSYTGEFPQRVALAAYRSLGDRGPVNEAAIQDIYRKAYLFTLLGDKMFHSQIRQLNQLFTDAVTTGGVEKRRHYYSAHSGVDGDDLTLEDVPPDFNRLQIQYDITSRMRSELAAHFNMTLLPLGRRQQASFGSLARADKERLLETWREADDRQTTPELLAECVMETDSWPRRWQTIGVDSYNESWGILSADMIAWLQENPQFLATDLECRQLLDIVLLAQGTASAFGATDTLLQRLVDLSDDCPAALANLQRYDYLPVSVLQPAIARLVRDRCHLIEEYDLVEAWAREQLSRFIDESDDTIAVELISTVVGKLSLAERARFTEQILTTGESDREFKTWYADQWGQRLPESFFPSLQDIAHLGFHGELSKDRGRFARAVLAAEQGPNNMLRNAGGISFAETYQSMFRLGSISKYLMLRDLCVTGGTGVYAREGSRAALMTRLFDHYLDTNALPEETQKTLAEITEAIAMTPDAYDLYYFTGPILASLAFQYPDHPVPIDEIVDDQTGKWIDRFKDRARDPRDQRRTLAVPGVADQTRQLFRSWVWTFLTGQQVDMRFDRANFQLNITPPADIRFSRLEDYVQDSLASETDGYELGHDLTPIDLAIAVAENTGALGIRWLQLTGLYSDFSPEERQKIDRMYYRVQGQDELTALRTIRREAALSPKLQALYDSVVRFNGVIGGGSIVTVFDAVDQEGIKWAVGVKDPNADYKATEMTTFMDQMVEHISQKRGGSGLEMTRMLLSSAAEWIKREINDPEYYERNARFAALNDYRSTEEGRFQPAAGIEWQIMVPEILDTGTDWVRWEEHVDGVVLAEAKIQGVDAAATAPKRWLRPNEARQIGSLIIQNYFFQMLETGLVHSDVHPGNFIVTPNNEVAIIDRKNLLLLDDDERQLMVGVIEKMARGKSDEAVESLGQYLMGEASVATRQEINRQIRERIERDSGRPVEDQVGDVLLALQDSGVEVPLKWILIIKNFLGLQKIAEWAHFGSLIDALLFSPANQTKDAVLRTVLPATARSIGPKLFLLRFMQPRPGDDAGRDRS